ALVGTTVLAQPGGPKRPPQDKQGKVARKVPRVQLRPEQVTVHRRTPIPHKPLELRELRGKDGKPGDPDARIPPAKAKESPAREYLAHLNHLEKQLNALGYSLRDRPEKSHRLATVVMTRKDRATLVKQNQRIVAAHRNLTGSQVKVPRVMPQQLARAVQAHQQAAKAAAVRFTAWRDREKAKVLARMKAADPQALKKGDHAAQRILSKANFVRDDRLALLQLLQEAQLSPHWRDNIDYFVRERDFDHSENWDWRAGDPGSAEAHVRG